MMSERPQYKVTFQCRFCGEEWFEDFPVDLGIRKTNASPRCFVSPDSPRGTEVRYGAAERKPSAAMSADRYLKRGEVYRVQRMWQWQHGCFVYLEGFDRYEFDLMIFTPVDFVPKGEQG